MRGGDNRLADGPSRSARTFALWIFATVAASCLKAFGTMRGKPRVGFVKERLFVVVLVPEAGIEPAWPFKAEGF